MNEEQGEQLFLNWLYNEAPTEVFADWLFDYNKAVNWTEKEPAGFYFLIQKNGWEIYLRTQLKPFPKYSRRHIEILENATIILKALNKLKEECATLRDW